jgi:hypothetical protein
MNQAKLPETLALHRTHHTRPNLLFPQLRLTPLHQLSLNRPRPSRRARIDISHLQPTVELGARTGGLVLILLLVEDRTLERGLGS